MLELLVFHYQCVKPELAIFGHVNPQIQIDPRERALVLALKTAREKQGISQNQLSKNIGISREAISKLESDQSRPTLWLLLKLSDGLGISVAKWPELMG